MSAGPPNSLPAVTDFGQYAGLRAAAQRNDPKALRQAAQQFEALLTETLLKTSRQAKLGDDLTGEQGDFYNDLFDQQMAQHLSAGKGLGLADMLVRQLGGLKTGQTPPTQALPPASASGSQPTGDVAAPAPKAGWKPQSAQDFVDAVRPHAEQAAAELGVPARVLIAQAALETGWGKHMARHTDGSSALNLFGVKAQPGWSGASLKHTTTEYRDGQAVTENASFRAYDSVGASFKDYVQFLKGNPRYAEALRSGSVHGFAQGLQKAGYATDPHYAQKLIKLAYGAQMSIAYGTPRTVSV
jgi:flagellar protein FlgJ